MKNNFRSYYTGMFYRPTEVFTNLINDKKQLRYSLLAVLITAILYTFVYVFLIFGGGLPFKPWLNIEPEMYYRWNVFFCAPSMFLAWILAAAVMHLKCRWFTNEGTFEQTVAMSGFSLSVASWSTGVHDVLTSFLGAVHIINQNEYEVMLNSPTIWRTQLWIQMLLYVFLFAFFFPKGLRVIYKLSWFMSIVFGVTGLLIYQGFFFIFNR